MQPLFIYYTYRIYSNKHHGAYVIFHATSAALVRGQRLFDSGAYLIIVPDKFTFSINDFSQQYTFYLLIFLWAYTKLIVNLELRQKFMWWKKKGRVSW